MNADYFKEHIKEELEGALDYAKNAIELKPMNANWSRMFIDMANAELEHATNLFKMFEEYMVIFSKSYQDVPDYLEEVQKEIVDYYTEELAKVKIILSTYK